MPTYGYECTQCNEKFETFQRITDDPLKVHEGCGGPLRRLVYPVGIQFKGSGFYVNDYARKSEPAAKTDKSDKADKPAEATSNGTGDAKPAADAPKAESAKPETKSDAKATAATT